MIGCGSQTGPIISKVSPTANPQVALYTVTTEAPGTASVQFGLDTNYGLTTWTQPISSGLTTKLLVAGMKSNTLYHMRAVVNLSDGTQLTDADHLFKTGSSAQAPTIIASTAPSMTPQSGIELLNLVSGPPTVSDLDGNVLWTYNSVPSDTLPNPIKLLPNGHFLINFSGVSVDGIDSVMREVDLTGAVIWQMTAADLNAALAVATCSGCNITVIGTHHDFLMLPNGHLVLIAATQEDISGTKVTGDVIVDLDQNHKPDWLWNEFDHLDVNRRPMGFPDWTHTNAILYSPDDGNLLVSIRHQNWLVKVDFEKGTGTGDILWKLGYEGDFTLVGGVDPTDWFYAQHGPSFVTSNTTGQFSIVLFDNGDDRVFPSDVTCNGTGVPPCLYSTVPLLKLDETAMTAEIAFHLTTPEYSFFGGNAGMLKNGNVEFCEAAGGPGTAGKIYEVTQGDSAKAVWQMEIPGSYVYRGQRIPSFYPGVQW